MKPALAECINRTAAFLLRGYAKIAAMNPEPPIPAPQAPPARNSNAETRIKPKELLITGLAYLIGVTLGYFIIIRFDQDSAFDLSHAVGSILATSIATWLYQSRNDELAPFDVKASVGATLAVLSIMQGLLFQRLFQWIPLDISLILSSVGAFIFPFLLWNGTGKALIQSRKPRGS